MRADHKARTPLKALTPSRFYHRAFIFLRQVCITRPWRVYTVKDTGMCRAFMCRKEETGEERRYKSDSGKKRSARTRFIVITTKTRYATICSDVQRCGFSAHRSRSQLRELDRMTLRRSLPLILYVFLRERKKNREEEQKNVRCLIDRTYCSFIRSFTESADAFACHSGYTRGRSSFSLFSEYDSRFPFGSDTTMMINIC